ncbi:hypothetical protein [Sphingorhabdus sp.]|uniref:hypothetical protein n=1 Tax=Sphingorhabdus sp. TaxID=1902408 RepID=UPI0039196001
MKKSFARKKRAFPRLRLPLLMGLILALPLAACGSKRGSEANRALNEPLSIDAALHAGALLHAPAPTIVNVDNCNDCAETRASTLGDRANSGPGRDKGKCNSQLQVANHWAERMPREFPVYPKARVEEAAGVDGGVCDIRAVSFTTAARLQNVVDYYYTRAIRSGFGAEYQIRTGAHVLGGIRSKDDGAYVFTFRQAKGGGTAVDIVASNGR